MSFHRASILLGFLVAVCLMGFVSPAEAAASKIGDVMTNVTTAFSKLPFVLSTVAYLLGLFFAVNGIFKFKDHVDNPAQHPLSAGVKRFLAGGMLLSGPFMANVLEGTFFGGGGGGTTAGGARHGSPGGGGMDQMIYDLISNVAGPTEKMLMAFSYIAGITLLLVAISRLTKTAQEGPRGPGGLGTLMTFLAAGALFSCGDMLGSFSTSLFGDSTISVFAKIDSSVISDSGEADKIAAVVEALMAFIMIVGYIAFIRGWFVLKAFADGSQSATLAQGLTFLFGGALAINLGELVNVLQTSVGLSGITFS